MACAALVGCQSGPMKAADFGEQLFSDSRLSESGLNSYACSTCHSVAASSDATRINSGYSLFNAAARPSWWGGNELDLLDAVNFCYVSFMRAAKPLAPDEAKSKALYEYLATITDASDAPPHPFTVVSNVTAVARGDPDRGQEVYRAACRVCHGEAQSGAGRISERVPLLPQATQDYSTVFPQVQPALVVVEKVRHGSFFHISGDMPLYSKEALSDQDLGALLAFLGL